VTPRRRRILSFIGLLVSAIVAGSFMPLTVKQRLGTPTHHHTFHFTVFCLAAFLMMWLVRRWHFQILMALASLALALFVEVGETFLFHNQMEWQDVIDDCIGIAVAVAVTLLLALRKRTLNPAASEK
jgi:VanZ family protein